MIYTVISDIRIFENYKRGARDMREPLSVLPAEIEEYIEKTKNEKVRAERGAAYLTLFSALKEFFSVSGVALRRTELGKPYLEGREDGTPHKISINLSHSGGAVAVTLSDEGSVGVDIQEKVSVDRAKRLDERFFTGKDVIPKEIGVAYFYMTLKDSEPIFESVELNESANDFSGKWAECEAILKCSGVGMSHIGIVDKLAEVIHCEVRTLKKSGKIYTIATAKEIKKP